MRINQTESPYIIICSSPCNFQNTHNVHAKAARGELQYWGFDNWIFIQFLFQKYATYNTVIPNNLTNQNREDPNITLVYRSSSSERDDT